MYLKEAFRYQNFLSTLIDRAATYLGNPAYTTKTIEEHFRKKANPEAEDETIEVQVDRPFMCDNNQLVSFIQHLMEEKEKLTSAISAAKRSCDVDIDAELANNRIRQRVSALLDLMSHQRSNESVVRGTSYKFNSDGNQVPYSYDVKRVTTIDFDRNKVKGICHTLSKKSDEVSTNIDKVMVELQVDYEPEFSINDSIEDAIEQFCGM